MDFDFNDVNEVEGDPYFFLEEDYVETIFFIPNHSKERCKMVVEAKYRYDDGVDSDPTHLEFRMDDSTTGKPRFRIHLKNNYKPVKNGPDWNEFSRGYGADFNVGKDYRLNQWTSWRRGKHIVKAPNKFRQRYRLIPYSYADDEEIHSGNNMWQS